MAEEENGKKVRVFKQTRKVNGDVSTSSVTYPCTDTEAAKIVSMLEGHVTVLEENTSLSKTTGSNEVAGGIYLKSISMTHSEAKSAYFGGYKPLIFKQSFSVTQIQAEFKLHKPYSNTFASQHPDNVYPTFSNINEL